MFGHRFDDGTMQSVFELNVKNPGAFDKQKNSLNAKGSL